MEELVILENISLKYSEIFSRDVLIEGVISNTAKSIGANVFSRKFAKSRSIPLINKLVGNLNRYILQEDEMDRLFTTEWFINALYKKIQVGLLNDLTPDEFVVKNVLFDVNRYMVDRFEMHKEYFIPGVPLIITKYISSLMSGIDFAASHLSMLSWLTGDEKYDLQIRVDACKNTLQQFELLIANIVDINKNNIKQNKIPKDMIELGNIYPDFGDKDSAIEGMNHNLFFTKFLDSRSFDACKNRASHMIPTGRAHKQNADMEYYNRLKNFLYEKLGYNAIRAGEDINYTLGYPHGLINKYTNKADANKIHDAIEYYMTEKHWPSWVRQEPWMANPELAMQLEKMAI